MKINLLPLICCLSASLYTTPGLAQSIDYTSFEEMFGEPVTTSANGSPQRLSEVPLNMEIVTAEDIARLGARSIPEALRYVSGISVRQISMGQTEVSIRGYNQADSTRILVLLNGRQVYIDTFGYVIWDNIPVEMSEIKQIEVVKGPNTALFGFNAISGVINIITYNPLYDEVREVKANVGVGNEQLAEASLVYTKKLDNYAVKISGGGYNISDEFKDLKDTGKVDDDAKRRSYSIDAYYKPSDKTELLLNVAQTTADRSEMMVTRHPGDTAADINSARTRFLAETSYGLVDADFYFTETYHSLFENEFRVNNKIAVAKISDTFEYHTNHIFRASAEYREANNMYDPFDTAELKYKIASISGLWDWRIMPKLRTSAALRFDHFKLSPNGDNVNPLILGYAIPELGLTADDFYQTRDDYSINLGASYQLTDKEVIKASYARGIDLPSFTEFGIQLLETLPTNRWAGNPYMKSAIVDNYELDYVHRMDEINGSFTASIFHQKTSDVQGFGAVIADDGTNYFTITGNLGDSEMSGFELGLEGKFKENWDWSANYTFLSVNDSLDNKSSGTNYKSPTEYEESTPNHVFNATLGYRAEKWRAAAGVQYTSRYKDLLKDSLALDGYALHNVDPSLTMNANYTYTIVEGLDVSVSGQNLFGNNAQSVYSKTEPMVWTSMKVKF